MNANGTFDLVVFHISLNTPETDVHFVLAFKFLPIDVPKLKLFVDKSKWNDRSLNAAANIKQYIGTL